MFAFKWCLTDAAWNKPTTDDQPNQEVIIEETLKPMSYKSRIRKPVSSDDKARQANIVNDVIDNKMANILKPKQQSDVDVLNAKLKQTINEVRDGLKPVLEAASKTGMFNHEANRSILAGLLLERMDKYTHDELVNTITMILTEEILNSL